MDNLSKCHLGHEHDSWVSRSVIANPPPPLQGKTRGPWRPLEPASSMPTLPIESGCPDLSQIPTPLQPFLFHVFPSSSNSMMKEPCEQWGLGPEAYTSFGDSWRWHLELINTKPRAARAFPNHLRSSLQLLPLVSTALPTSNFSATILHGPHTPSPHSVHSTFPHQSPPSLPAPPPPAGTLSKHDSSPRHSHPREHNLNSPTLLLGSSKKLGALPCLLRPPWERKRV